MSAPCPPSPELSALRCRRAQLTIGPRRRVGRVQWTHRRGNRRRRIDDADAFVHPEHLVRPRRERRCFRCARPVVEVEIHEIEVPLQLTERLENLRIVEPVHFHRELRNRREQFVWRCEKRFPFSAFDVHLDDHTPAGIAVFANLVFQRVEETRIPVAASRFPTHSL